MQTRIRLVYFLKFTVLLKFFLYQWWLFEGFNITSNCYFRWIVKLLRYIQTLYFFFSNINKNLSYNRLLERL